MVKIPQTESIITNLENSWLTISFNRPEKRNALSKQLIMDIFQILETVRDDRSVRGITFRGQGGTFCAGADLKEFQEILSAGDKAKKMADAASSLVGQLFKIISASPQVTVSVVEGAAMAGGFGIACSTDLLITMSNARYALTETQIGLTPAQIAPYVINRLGFAKGKKMMLLGDHIDGNDALEIGLADYVADDTEKLSEILENIQQQVMQCAPGAIAVTKEIIDSCNTINTVMAADLFSDCLVGEEGQEGFSSFFEKRKPYWAIST